MHRPTNGKQVQSVATPLAADTFADSMHSSQFMYTMTRQHNKTDSIVALYSFVLASSKKRSETKRFHGACGSWTHFTVWVSWKKLGHGSDGITSNTALMAVHRTRARHHTTTLYNHQHHSVTPNNPQQPLTARNNPYNPLQLSSTSRDPQQ